jgi:hypothetical protein
VTGLASALCRSDQKTSALKECCDHFKIAFRKPIKVVATQWNSHIAALHRAHENKEAIQRLTSEAKYDSLKLEKFHLREVEWQVVRDLFPLLEVSLPFQFNLNLTIY